MYKRLIFFWRGHLAVALGAAIATSVLAGALIVGDSVRGSLRDLVLDRIGKIDHAIVSGGFVGQGLGGRLDDELGGLATIEPLILLRATAVNSASGSRATDTRLFGVDSTFSGLFDHGAPLELERRDDLIHPPVALNRNLAQELGVDVGDEILVSFERPAEVSRETLVGREEAIDTIETMRLSVGAILPDTGLGGFRLTPQQATPLNLFVELARIQRSLFGRSSAERVNTWVIAGQGGEAPPDLERLETALDGVLELEDLGLALSPGISTLTLGSREFVLSPALAEATLDYARATTTPTQGVLTYLANSIEMGDRKVPYSTVVALDPATAPNLGLLRLTDGTAAPLLADDEILLNSWAAEDLSARVGETVRLVYYQLGSRDELSVATADFRLAGIVALDGLAVDEYLTPKFPGMHEAEDIAAWSPPFPVDLSRIRERDEEYWDTFRAAPKAFVGATAGRRLWASRFGDLTSLRLAPREGSTLAELNQRLLRELPGRIGSERGGLVVQPLREQGLERAQGATDFTGLFFGLSLFLIASAALLVGLLFRLAVEQRAREVGLLRAIGFPAKTVLRRFLGEGLIVAAIGTAAGLIGAAAYAALMLAGLRTWWLPAIGAPVLFLHLEPSSLLFGALGSFTVVAVTIWLAIRRLARTPAPALLAGATADHDTSTKPGRRAKWVTWIAASGALLILGAAIAAGATQSPMVALGLGTTLLVAGIALFAMRCGVTSSADPARSRFDEMGVAAMGARNAGRSRGRSILSVSLVASAVFSLVAVGANRGEVEVDVRDRASGAGGFTVAATAGTPIHVDLDSAERLAELGFSSDERKALEDVAAFPFRLLPGEDASCLNLYRPQQPRVLGVTPAMVERGGFSFQAANEAIENPWTLLDRDLGPGVIPAIGDYNSVRWILHLGLGKDLVLEDERGRPIRLRFVGLLKKSLFQSEVLISEAAFMEHFPSRTGFGWFLFDTGTSDPPDVSQIFERNLASFGFDTTSTATRLADFQAVENTYISTFQTLGGLGLILGTLGLGIVLLRNVLERQGELATLRAFGFRRRRLAHTVVAENAYLLFIGVAIGTFAGLVTAAPHVLSAGSGFPWFPIAATVVLVLASGMLASVLAVRGTLRTPLLPALKAN